MICLYLLLIAFIGFFESKAIAEERSEELAVFRSSLKEMKTTEEFVQHNDSLLIVKQFWTEHVHSFKIHHGTSSLYYDHFKTHGISPTYPLLLEKIIPKILFLWGNHEHDIAEKSYYFRNFERRYEAAHQAPPEIACFFSAQPIITREHTVGYNQGGEWVRELKFFLDKASNQAKLLTEDENKIRKEALDFVNLITQSPPMVISLRATSPSFKPLLDERSLFLPFDLFLEYIRSSCHDWQDPLNLHHHLYNTILPRLAIEKQKISSLYEVKLSNFIPPEELEFEMVDHPLK